MPSQFFGLNIAYTGLLASNASLNTTANNISNVHTEGYSRQHVVKQAAQAIRVFQTYGCAGAGVETLAIERIRDEFYDAKYWNNNTLVGEYETKSYYMKQIETYFDDDGISGGFKTIYDKLMTESLEELMKNPDSADAKKQFIGAADALVEYFNNLAGNMEKLQKDVNQEIKVKVDQINSLASEIATLNKQINVIELSGAKANELRDRRTLLLDQLSKIIDIEVAEIPIADTNQPDRETGANRFIIKISGGQTLVDTAEYNGLECRARQDYEKVNQTDIDGLYDIYWSGGQKFNMYDNSMSGELRGLIQMRDGNNGENFAGTITGIGTTDDGRQDTVTIRVGKDTLKDLNKCNLSDQGGIINLGNQEFYYDSWKLVKSFDAQGNEVYSYTFTLSASPKNTQRLTNDRVGMNGTIGTSLNYQGVPYYMNQMNEWVRTFAQKFNDILKSGFDSYNKQGNILFTGDMTVDDDQYDFPDGTRYDLFDYDAFVAGGSVGLTVDVTDDSYYRLTAANFSIMAAMLSDPGLLANRRDSADGVEQNDLLEELRAMGYNKEYMTFRGCNASEFLQCVLGDIALNASRANTFTENYTSIGYSIDNQRLSISGVDEDEEAVNLVKFQNAYNLASKMIQTLTEIYDKLILETGV